MTSDSPDVPPSATTIEAVDPRLRERRIGTGLAWLGTWSWRWVGVALAIAVLGWLVGMVWSALFPVLLALIVASVLAPAVGFLVRRVKLPRAAAAGLVVIGTLVVVGGVIAGFAPSVAGQGDRIASDAAQGLEKLEDWAVERELVTEKQVTDALSEGRERLQNSAGSIANGLLSGVNTITSGLVTLLLTLVLTFLFLKDGHRFRPWAARMTGPRVGGHVDAVLDQMWTTLGGFVRAQALVSLIDAVLIGIALAVIGVPLVLPLAVLTFFGGFVPIIGAVLAGAIAVLVALVSVGFKGALILLVVILVVQQLEGNVLHPWLQSRAMQLHAGVVILAVTLGSTLFGIAGAFLAVPLTAVAAVVLRYLSALADPAPPPAVVDGPPPGPAQAVDPAAPGSPAPDASSE
ncbi:AI-2E family transporter [Nocardioides sp. zg-579]|uniref:AI-2E family transporter n=1 Tax=Nocardioides marmotae TaxID=2663857 RepID=A0A6I3J7U2_9ACTN|nr:AI-2E family transporter [Nocardioides marmotae]MCR6030623.1 AI-2E family transporter [Gordonia jinghuaiqii]MTB94259.1 AI-2E family transporter [Nocardioides marmotae]QKE00536.1 AI-2E family transporter [Nocardioides marmotae]